MKCVVRNVFGGVWFGFWFAFVCKFKIARLRHLECTLVAISSQIKNG